MYMYNYTRELAHTRPPMSSISLVLTILRGCARLNCGMGFGKSYWKREWKWKSVEMEKSGTDVEKSGKEL